MWRIAKEQANDLVSNNIESRMENLILTSNKFTAIWKGKKNIKERMKVRGRERTKEDKQESRQGEAAPSSPSLVFIPGWLVRWLDGYVSGCMFGTVDRSIGSYMVVRMFG